jgi:hypothetical protein
MKRILSRLSIFLSVNFLLLFSTTEMAMSEKQNLESKLNCTNYVQLKYNKGWDKVYVRLGDKPELLFDSTTKQLSTTSFHKKKFRYIAKDNVDNKNIKLPQIRKISVTEQSAELVVNYDKDGKRSEVMISIRQMNTIESAFEHFIDTCLSFGMRSRPGFLAFPNEKFFTDAIQQSKISTEIKNLKLKFSDNTLEQLARNSDYFFAHNDWVPNLALLYKNNICVLIQDVSSVVGIVDREHINNTRPNLREMLALADFTGHLFEKNPDKNVTVKDAPAEQLSLSVIKNSIRESGKCKVSWKLTSDVKLPLYGSWVRCDVDKGTLEIDEPITGTVKKSIEENTIKLNRPDDEGKIIISNIPSTGCTLTAYAITPDGKTWYKHQIKMDTKEQLLPPVNYPYRRWESFDGQYTMTARLLSIEGIEDFDMDEIDIDKLKDKMITIEKKENKKLIKVKFNNLSTKDQEYLIKQIKTTE